jgi:hypothetical protein
MPWRPGQLGIERMRGVADHDDASLVPGAQGGFSSRRICQRLETTQSSQRAARLWTKAFHVVTPRRIPGGVQFRQMVGMHVPEEAHLRLRTAPIANGQQSNRVAAFERPLQQCVGVQRRSQRQYHQYTARANAAERAPRITPSRSRERTPLPMTARSNGPCIFPVSRSCSSTPPSCCRSAPIVAPK